MKETWNDKKSEHAFRLYLKAIKDVIALNEEFGEKFLDNNKFPCDLSESLVARALINGEVCLRLGKLLDVCRTNHPDITADGHRIAVKGTSKENGWVSYTEEDATCEVLVWLNFYPLVFDNKRYLTATSFYNPTEYIPNSDVNKNITYDKLSSMYEIGGCEDLEIVQSISFPGVTEHNLSNISFDDQLINNIWNQWITLEA